MEFIKKNFKYFFFFCLTLFIFSAFGMYVNCHDSIWNYGFSYSMARGQIPYKEFTMIIPPFYNFIMSLGLRFISLDNIVFIIEQSLIITALFYFLYKMFGNKSWFLLPLMAFPAFIAFSPTYNLFIFFLSVIVIYFEKNNKSDYLIGFVLGLMMLTKYTVAIFLILPSIIYYFKEKDKILKRFVGLIIPCVIFLIYLICSDSLYNFIDLCVLGLFDFAKENGNIFSWLFVISLLFLGFSIYKVIKNPKEIINWYVLFSFFIMIPNFSTFHFYVYMLFMSLLFYSSNINLNNKYCVFTSVIVVCLIILLHQCLTDYDIRKLVRYENVHNFRYFYSYNYNRDNLYNANRLYLKYKNKSTTYFLANESVWLNVINNEDTNYFTVLNKGNYGYDGTNKMINRIKNMDDTYFIIDMNNYYYGRIDSWSQHDCELIDYIMENGECVEKVGDLYKVYYIR